MSEQRYRKKPVEVDAIQWTGDNHEDVLRFAIAYHPDSGPMNHFWPLDPEDAGDDPDMTAEVFDNLHSTWIGVYTGNWIIRGVRGEFYPCADDVFRATYEPVEEGA